MKIFFKKILIKINLFTYNASLFWVSIYSSFLRHCLYISKNKRTKIFRAIINGTEIQEDYSLIRYGYLKKYLDTLEPDQAILTMKKIFAINIDRITKKEKIKIGFVAHSSAEWQCDGVYNFFKDNDNFDVSIYVTGYGAKKYRKKRTEETKEMFISKGYKKVEVLFQRPFMGLNEMEKEDILIYMIPYKRMFPETVNFDYRNITQLTILFPYGVMMAERSGKYFMERNEYLYDNSIHQMCWHYFSSSQEEQIIIEKETRLNGYNSKFLGFPKIDELLCKSYYHRGDSLWKGGDSVKYKIIWAPHWNFRKGGNGTFDKNYRWFYEYAKRKRDISWIVRPHPRMYTGVVKTGLFIDKREYEQYFNAWNELDNARVVVGGGYYDIFDTSDAMILDSLSFIAEYFYTGKPLLLLKQETEEMTYNELGRELRNCSYSVIGDDFKGIENFIDNLIENDPKKGERKDVFDKYMGRTDDMTSSEAIYRCICNELHR